MKPIIRAESSDRWRNQVLCRHTRVCQSNRIKLSPDGITSLSHMLPARRGTIATNTGAFRPRSAKRSEVAESRFLALAGALIHRPTPRGCDAVPAGWRAAARSSAAEARAAQSGNSDPVARVQHDAIARLERKRVNGTLAE